MKTQTKITMAIACAMAISLARPAMALNNQSWVSRNGSDANDCSSTHPCRTYQHAQDVTASGGEVDTLDAGDYGPVTINKTLILDGGNMGHISTAASGVSVKGPVNSRVVVRRLSIGPEPGSVVGTGISWNSGTILHVEGVSIDNAINGIGAGPFASDSNGRVPTMRLFVNDAILRDCSDFGINLQPFTSFTATIEHVTIENNTSSSANSGGILVLGAAASVRNSVISRVPVAVAVEVEGQMNLENSTISFADTGVDADGAGTVVRLDRNTIHYNATGLSAAHGAQIVSLGNNEISGNGTGETPTSTVALK